MSYKRLKENLIKYTLLACAISSTVIILYILYFMLSVGNSQIVGWIKYGMWSPGYGYMQSYVFGSVYIASGGTLLGLVIGLPCAIYMAEFADIKLRNVLKPVLEVLNGFPSVIIGLVGFYLLVTQVSVYGFGQFGYSTNGCILFGWLILGIMALPLIASVAEDSIRAVPYELKEASLGLGATKWQTTTRVLIPGAMSGILTSILLAFGSGIGETLALYWVIANRVPPPLSLSPFAGSNTLTVFMLMNNGETGPVLTNPTTITLFGIAFVLFLITATINLAIRIALSKRGKLGGGSS